jgi:glycosyltransferase involved in cell wall biosynthesis
MLLSVIIPVFNGQRFLRDAVANVLAQGHEPLEIIVVDDGSTDDTPALIRSFGPRVISVRLDQNRGPAAARNAGIDRARGSVIGFLDVDDLWPIGRLPAMIEPLLGDPACSVVKGYARVCHTLDPEANPHLVSEPVLGPWIGSAIYRKQAFEDVGLFDAGMTYTEDIDWFLRARERRIGLYILDTVTLLVRRHDANMTLGKDCYDMKVMSVLKRSLDRRRDEAGGIARQFPGSGHPAVMVRDENLLNPVPQRPF